MRLVAVKIPESFLEGLDDLVRTRISRSPSAIIPANRIRELLRRELFGHPKDLEVLERIVRSLGFEVSKDHEVVQSLDSITFRVNLQENMVYAEISNCHTCQNNCKVSKKLCIEIAEKGYSTIEGLGDLRTIATLLAIREKTITTIKGTNPQENLSNQIARLVEKWKQDCKEVTPRKKLERKINHLPASL